MFSLWIETDSSCRKSSFYKEYIFFRVSDGDIFYLSILTFLEFSMILKNIPQFRRAPDPLQYL